MKKISFISAPLIEQSNQSTYNNNYGVERLIGSLIKSGMALEDIVAYEFSDQVLSEALIPKILNLIEPSEIFGFSTYSFNYLPTLVLASEIKKKYPDSKVLVGGAAASELKQEILQVHHNFIDYVIVGMAEEAIVSFMDNLNLENKSNIPNLIWSVGQDSNKTILINDVIYPPKGWEEVMPHNFNWKKINDTPTSYKQFKVLSSIGYSKNFKDSNSCNYCSILYKEPKFANRPMKHIIKEIKLRFELAKEKGEDKIALQILDQNFIPKLPSFVKALKNEEQYSNPLLENMVGLSIISRADALLQNNNVNKLENLIKSNPNMIVGVGTGIENYSDKILKELGKGVTAEQNIEATKVLVKLSAKYSNFIPQVLMIGVTPKTTVEDLMANIIALKEIGEFGHLSMLNFLSPLHYEVAMASKLGIKRPLGGYLPPIKTKEFISNTAVPEDSEVRYVINKAEQYNDKIPSPFERNMVLAQCKMLNINAFGTLFRGLDEDSVERMKAMYFYPEINFLYGAIKHNLPQIRPRIESAIESVNTMHKGFKKILEVTHKQAGSDQKRIANNVYLLNLNFL